MDGHDDYVLSINRYKAVCVSARKSANALFFSPVAIVAGSADPAPAAGSGTERFMALDVLIIDESPLCRDLLTSVLAAQGYTTAWIAVADAEQALAQSPPSVVVLEPGPAGSEGWNLLDHLLHERTGGHVPGIVILTDQSGKGEVLRAAQAGVRDYMLKQRFSLPEFLTRVRRHAAPGRDAVEEPEPPRPAQPAAALLASPASRAPVSPLSFANSGSPDLARVADEAGLPVLTGKVTLERLDSASLKTLPGAVADLMALSNSTRATIADLAQILLRDPVLTAGILRVANSAAFSPPRGRVGNVEDAVKTIGVSGVRNLVVNVGIFNAFACDTDGGLWVPWMWQHCLGVAMLMEKLAPHDESVPAGSAYLVGLCHDLSDIVLRQKFADHYAATRTLVTKSQCTYREAFAAVFGLPYAELVSQLLSRLHLPPLITVPIEEFFNRGERRSPSGSGSLLGRSLRAANSYAHGLLLAPSQDDFVMPLTRAECANTFGAADPVHADDQMIRAQAIATAAALAGLSPSQTQQLCEPMVLRQPLRVGYCRHPDFSTLDPLEAFLRLTGLEVAMMGSLEQVDSALLDQVDVIIVAGAPRAGNDTCAQELDRLKHLVAARPLPALYLRGRGADQVSPEAVTVHRLPIPIRSLGGFLADAVHNAPNPPPAYQGPG